jgi:hypothetical protein
LKEPKGEVEDANARGRIATLEEKANQHDRDIAILQTEVRQLSTDFERLVGEVSALRCAAMSPTVTQFQNQPYPPSPAASPVSPSHPLQPRNIHLLHLHLQQSVSPLSPSQTCSCLIQLFCQWWWLSILSIQLFSNVYFVYFCQR